MTTIKKLFFTVLLLSLAPVATAQDNAQEFGDYVVHYNAFPSDVLSPEIAKAYGIVRSKSRAVVNIVVLKKVLGTTGEPVTATVKGSATNLTKQLKTLDMREVREGNAIYYLAEVAVSDGETLDFVINVAPSGSTASQTVNFRKQFFTH